MFFGKVIFDQLLIEIENKLNYFSLIIHLTNLMLITLFCNYINSLIGFMFSMKLFNVINIFVMLCI